MEDKILDRLGIQYEDLTQAEKDTYNTWLDSLKKNSLTLEDVKHNLSAMRAGVEDALIDEPEFNYLFIFKIPNRKQIYLKARLKNYLLLEAFLTTPDRAKQALERSISSLPKAAK